MIKRGGGSYKRPFLNGSGSLFLEGEVLFEFHPPTYLPYLLLEVFDLWGPHFTGCAAIPMDSNAIRPRFFSRVMRQPPLLRMKIKYELHSCGINFKLFRARSLRCVNRIYAYISIYRNRHTKMFLSGCPMAALHKYVRSWFNFKQNFVFFKL